MHVPVLYVILCLTTPFGLVSPALYGPLPKRLLFLYLVWLQRGWQGDNLKSCPALAVTGIPHTARTAAVQAMQQGALLAVLQRFSAQ